jgi:hypothetical protein
MLDYEHNLHGHQLYIPVALNFPEVTIIVIKPGRMRLEKHTENVGETIISNIFWIEGLKGRNHLEDPDASGRLTIKAILKEEHVGVNSVHLAQDRNL